MRIRGILIVAVCLTAVGAADAGTRVLDGVANYMSVPAPDSGIPASMATGPDDFAAATIEPDGPRPIIGANPLTGVPRYIWWYGCSPTSGGMMVAYWDQLPGRGNLYDGDASVWGGGGASGTRSMVASTAHITAGTENGYTHGDWHNSASYPTHQANPDCLADFMETVDGGSYSPEITSGLEDYCQWDNPNTAVNEAYPATAVNYDVPYWGGAFTYTNFKAEIDANRPVLLNVLTYSQGDWYGHSVVGYGYNDNMFQVKVPLAGGAEVDLTVGGMAVRDTWSAGSAQSEWVDWDWNVIGPVISGDLEWWPFIAIQGSSWYYTDGSPGPFDWMVSDAVTLDVVPEPATLMVLAVGAVAVVRRRRRAA